MAELIGFLIVFGILAALIGTLSTGLVRIIGFGVLVAFMLIIGAPAFRAQLPTIPFFNSASRTQSSSQNAPAANYDTPTTGGSYDSTSYPAQTTPATGGTTAPAPSTGSSTSTRSNTRRGGVRALW